MAGMDRIDTGRPGVVEFRDVPVVDGADHRTGAYLHLSGLSRESSSMLLRAFLLVEGDPTVESGSGPEHPGYLADGAVYLSPPGPGGGPSDLAVPPDQGSYDMRLNVSRRLGALAPPGPAVDLALTLRDPTGSPVDPSGFHIGHLEITRR
jgi:hypothetical protein